MFPQILRGMLKPMRDKLDRKIMTKFHNIYKIAILYVQLFNR